MAVGRGRQFVHCREVVHSSECPLSEVPLYRGRVAKVFFAHALLSREL